MRVISNFKLLFGGFGATVEFEITLILTFSRSTGRRDRIEKVMLTEDFELRLNQYLDGTLPVDEAASFFDTLAQSPAAWALLDEYRRLDAVLQAPAGDVDWAAMLQRINQSIDQAPEMERDRFRIDRAIVAKKAAEPSRFRMPAAVRYAAAACLAISAGASLMFLWQGKSPVVRIGQTPAGRVAIAQISGPAAEVAASTAQVQIEIGPGPVAAAQEQERYAELSPGTPRVVIASGVEVRQDAGLLPY